jgi:hypothetical protein
MGAMRPAGTGGYRRLTGGGRVEGTPFSIYGIWKPGYIPNLSTAISIYTRPAPRQEPLDTPNRLHGNTNHHHWIARVDDLGLEIIGEVIDLGPGESPTPKPAQVLAHSRQPSPDRYAGGEGVCRGGGLGDDRHRP